MNSTGHIKKRQGGYGVAPAQDQLAAFVKATMAQQGRLPSRAEIQKEMGWRQRGSVRDCLMKMRFGGKLPHAIIERLLTNRTMIAHLGPQSQREPDLNHLTEKT